MSPCGFKTLCAVDAIMWQQYAAESFRHQAYLQNLTAPTISQKQMLVEEQHNAAYFAKKARENLFAII